MDTQTAEDEVTLHSLVAEYESGWINPCVKIPLESILI